VDVFLVIQDVCEQLLD